MSCCAVAVPVLEACHCGLRSCRPKKKQCIMCRSCVSLPLRSENEQLGNSEINWALRHSCSVVLYYGNWLALIMACEPPDLVCYRVEMHLRSVIYPTTKFSRSVYGALQPPGGPCETTSRLWISVQRATRLSRSDAAFLCDRPLSPDVEIHMFGRP